MSDEKEESKPKALTVGLNSLELSSSVPKLTVWNSYSFAPEWYEDVIREARTGDSHESRRREILFAVCCVESYLFEWVRDEVLDRQFRELPKYFPQDYRKGIRARWKRVIRLVHDDGLIDNLLDFNASQWTQFVDLVNFRNGLIHGNSSRPDTASLEEKQRPMPSKDQLDQMDSGWAASVIVNLIKQLHAAVGTDPPGWLMDP